MTTKNSPQLIPQLFLSLLTVPMMTTKMSGEKLIDMLEQMGKASEEVFRGERLPILRDHHSVQDGKF